MAITAERNWGVVAIVSHTTRNTVRQGYCYTCLAMGGPSEIFMWVFYVLFLRSRPGKPNQRKGQNEKLMNFAHFCEFWCFSLGKQAQFTLNFCSGMPLRKVHELTFLWFGLPGPLLIFHSPIRTIGLAPQRFFVFCCIFPFSEVMGSLSGPVLRDTARLSQRYPPIARYGVFGVSTWPIGCDTPPPFSERFALAEHAKWRCDTPPPFRRGISAILARYPMKTRQMGAIPPSAILSRKGIAR